MTIHLPPRGEDGNALDVSYCSACMICKADGFCYQNQDYDKLVMRLGDADLIVIEKDGGLALQRLLHPEETWFPKRRIAFLRGCYARVRGIVIVEDPALLEDVKKLFINADITGGEKDA